MASITYAFAYFYNLSTNTIVSAPGPGTFVVTDTTPPTNLLVPGDAITSVNGGSAIDGTYLGAVTLGTGGIAVDAGTLGILFTDDGSIANGTVITVVEQNTPICFLEGTLIATAAGAAAIETLRPGDLVLTSGGERQPVRWLGVQTVSTFFADPLRVLPIRVAAGALGDGLPARDLFVSSEHALLIEGLLVQAGALVNGTSITRHAEMPERFRYYHVELADHSLILAEGVAAETFVDNVERGRFDNWREAPEAPPLAEMELPRVKAWRQVPAALRARLAERAVVLLGDKVDAA